MEGPLAGLGFDVLAISPDRPETMIASLEVESPGYQLYSDSDLAAARAFGIAFRVDEQERARYAEFGIDLEEASGRAHHMLPVPSVFLVEAGGAIRWAYSNPDYRVRPDNAALLAAARRVAPAEPGD